MPTPLTPATPHCGMIVWAPSLETEAGTCPTCGAPSAKAHRFPRDTWRAHADARPTRSARALPAGR